MFEPNSANAPPEEPLPRPHTCRTHTPDVLQETTSTPEEDTCSEKDYLSGGAAEKDLPPLFLKYSVSFHIRGIRISEKRVRLRNCHSLRPKAPPKNTLAILFKHAYPLPSHSRLLRPRYRLQPQVPVRCSWMEGWGAGPACLPPTTFSTEHLWRLQEIILSSLTGKQRAGQDFSQPFCHEG